MSNRARVAQRRFLAECVTMAVVALLWLASLVWGLGGPRATQAISNFGLIAAAGAAGITCVRTARSSSAQQSRMWKLLGASALSWGTAEVSERMGLSRPVAGAVDQAVAVVRELIGEHETGEEG
jgi:hypothetical protein